MGRKLDISNLSEEEAEHVLQVVQRDMQLRKKEEGRLSELKQELDKEESRCVLLSRQRGFNERCCIRCCSSFTFFLKARRQCSDCRYNVCKRCCSYSDTDKSWLCSACEKSRLLKTQSLEWFYSNVRRRFRRFGSAKVLKMLYRKHVGDQGSQAEFTEGSTYAESTDDSVYESDSTFYKHTEERSMAESISVALRVAKEAIDEAISKAEKQPCNQKKLKEACYLRDNKGELIEELTTMILQTIICKSRDLSETHTEFSLEPPPDRNRNSQSALSILTEDILAQHDKTEQNSTVRTQGLKPEEVPAVASSNQNMDWKENSCASSVLQSPDGNWFAMQSTQLSRLSLPTKRENLMFSGLEKKSGVISDRMTSDTESDSDGTWDANRLRINRKLSASNLFNDHHATSLQPDITSLAKYTADQPQSDSDQSNLVTQLQSPSLCHLKRKESLADKHMPCQCHSAMGMTVNPYGGESSEDDLEDNRVRKTRRRRRNKRDAREGKGSRVCSGERLSLSEPDYGRMLLNYLLKSQSKRQSMSEFSSDETMTADTPDSVTPDFLKSEGVTTDASTPDAEDLTNKHHVLSYSSDEQLTAKLGELANQVNGTQLSITKNGICEVEEHVDERHDESEEAKKEKKVKERREALRDMKVDVQQKDLDINKDKDQKDGKGLVDVDDNKIENKRLRNSETLSTNMFDNLNNEMLQESVEKESAFNMERLDRMSQKVFYDCKIETKREPKKHRQGELYSVDNTDSDGLSQTDQCKANYTNKKRALDQNVEQKNKDRPVSREKHDTKPEPLKRQDFVKNEACLDPDGESPLETPVESRIQKIKRIEAGGKQEDTEYEAKNENNSGDNRGSRKSVNKETERLTYSQDNHDSVEGGKSERKQKTTNLLKDLNILENEYLEKEAQISNTIYIIPHLTDDSSREDRMEEQMPQVNVIGFHTETINRDERTEENDVANESEGNNVKKTEAEEFQELTLEDVQDGATSGQEEFLSPEKIYNNLRLEKDLQFIFTLLQQKYSAASLRSLTTEVLKVLNATEDLIQGAVGLSQSESLDPPALPPTQSKRLDGQLSQIEENVYVAASAIFGLEAELGDLEECARSISGDTRAEEISHLEEQVASAAAQVHQSELQVTDIAARIEALKSAGLNVAPQTRFSKPQTLDSSRQHRRRLPAPPVQGKKI